MRKLLLLLVGFLVSFAASAATYVNITGNFNNWGNNGLSPVNNVTTHKALPIGTSGFKVKMWDGEDHWFSTGGVIKQDAWVKISGNDGDMYIQGAQSGDKFDVKFNVSTNEIFVSKVVENLAEKKDCYLVGDFGGGWNENRTDYTMNFDEAKADGTYTGTFTLTAATSYIKIKIDGAIYGCNGNDIPMVEGTEYTTVSGGDKTYTVGPGKYTFTFTNANKKFKVEKYVEPIIPVAKVIGFDNSELKWGEVYAHLYNGDKTTTWPGVKMNKGADDVWTVDAASLDFDPANVIFNNGDKMQTAAEAFEVDKTYKPKVYTVNVNYVDQVTNWGAVNAYFYNDEQNSGWPGAAMVKGDNDIWGITQVLSFEPTKVIFSKNGDKQVDFAYESGKTYGEYAVVEPDKGYIVGQFGDNWNQNRTDYPMEYADGVYTAKYEFKNNGNYFLIKVGDAYYSCSSNSADNTSNGGEWTTTTQKVQSFLINKGTYTFTFTVADKKLKIEKEIAGPDYSKYYVKVVGGHNNWNWSEGGVKPTNGVATQNVELGNNPFQICVWNGTQDVRYSAGKEIALNQWVAANSGSGLANTSIAGAKAGNTYKVEFNLATNQIRVTLVGSVAPDPEAGYTYLYFNMGEDWLTKYNQDFVPHCHVYNKDNNLEYNNADKKAWGDEREAMENVAYQIWAFKVPTDEISKYNNAIFYVKDGDNFVEYNIANRQSTSEFDAENWTKYIYGPDVWWADNANHYGVRQSYVTYDQLRAADSRRRNALYLVGEGIGSSSWDISSLENLVENTNYFRADNGCFYIDLDVNRDAAFKLSWINPVAYANANGYTEHNNNRMWATFDLGLIGVDDRHEKFEDGTLDKNTVDAANNNCTFLPAVSMPYNHYNQFNWVVDDANMTGDIKDPYIVVDTEEQTLTLIMFNPNPRVEAMPTEVTTIDLTYPEAKQLHDAGSHHMKACEVNGHQIYDKVNVAGGSVHITGASGPEFNNNFTVEYTVYMNDSEMLKTETVDQDFGVQYMALGESDNLKVRARYISNATGLAFHSRTGEGTMTWDGKVLEAPNLNIMNSQHVVATKPGEDGKYNVNALLNASYDTYYMTTELAHYVDFEVEANGVTTAYIFSEDMSGYDKSNVKPMKNWVRHDGESDFTDANSWTKAVHNNPMGDLPLLIPGVQRVDNPARVDATPVNMTAYAVYPFLVNPTGANAARLAPRRAAAEKPSDLSRFAVINVPVGVDAEHTIDASKTVTGIDTVTSDANAEVEYFTIQGIRVSGNLTPGIYIRRTGDKAEKVYIR